MWLRTRSGRIVTRPAAGTGVLQCSRRHGSGDHRLPRSRKPNRPRAVRSREGLLFVTRRRWRPASTGLATGVRHPQLRWRRARRMRSARMRAWSHRGGTPNHRASARTRSGRGYAQPSRHFRTAWREMPSVRARSASDRPSRLRRVINHRPNPDDPDAPRSIVPLPYELGQRSVRRLVATGRESPSRSA